MFTYKNGNIITKIFEDGTKIRVTFDDKFNPAFAENIDIKINNKCTGTNCAFCHEGSGPNGKNPDILKLKFVNTLHKGQEVAIGGGNCLEHPQLTRFLKKLKTKQVIPNITVNQIHFLKYYDMICKLKKNKLVYGIGVSLANPTDELIEKINNPIFNGDIVIHTINGVVSVDALKKLSGNKLKLLILGYKQLRRGDTYFTYKIDSIRQKQSELRNYLISKEASFSVISFDNLAVEQLRIKDIVTDKDWNVFYMGDDGTSTFYIDCVEKQFAKNSTTPSEDRHALLDSVDEMFEYIRKENKK